MTNKREPGYYWVHYIHADKNEWEIGWLTNRGAWRTIGTDHSDEESAFDEIGSRITPSMKYTEEDMRDVLAFSLNPNRCDKSEEEDFNDWLKQRKEGK